MSTTQKTTKTWPSDTKPAVTKHFAARPESSGTTVLFVSRKETKLVNERTHSPLDSKPQWRDREYREAYMEAAIDQGIAWQIRINRKLRNISQTALAEAIGTQQSAISRLEDPEYGSHNLETLKQVAKAFDCALLVKFVSYGDLANESQNLSETDQYAAPYALELENCHGQEKH